MILINSKKSVFFSGLLIGALIFFGLSFLSIGDSDQHQTIQILEKKIQALEAALAKKDQDLITARLLALRQNSKVGTAYSNSTVETSNQVKGPQQDAYSQNDNGQVSAASTPSSTQVLKDLATNSVNDPRSFSEKANELLSNEPSSEKIAIVSKGIFDMASDRESLPDYVLQTMYSNQTDPDLKRVIAQVLSSRGNNTLIDNQIAEAQTRLKSDSPSERQQALTHLAKMHSSTAVNAIAPLLHDSEIDVKLDALLAMRATGNQSHVSMVEKLMNDPDPAVSSLASDVVGHLKNLSDNARTTVISADIAAELPLMEHP